MQGITNEERIAKMLASLACKLNKRCGQRSDNLQPHSYSGFGVDMALLESAVYAPFQSVFGEIRYPSVYDRAAALIVHVSKAHAFNDGNKRTALHLGLTYLELEKVCVAPPDGETGAELVVKIVESHASFDELVERTSKTLIKWTQPDMAGTGHRKFWASRKKS